MSAEDAYLAFVLAGPMQSWGCASRFDRRTTGLHPSKSGVIGMICAALGLAKGSPEERELLPLLGGIRMTSVAMPRHGVLRLEDYHTVLETRRASGKPNEDAVISRRQYLLDARFVVILGGDRTLLQRVSRALADPKWGVWLGRKSCVPSEPINPRLFDTEGDAQREVLGGRPIDGFSTVAEVGRFEDGTDSVADQPVSFGDGRTSGPEGRRFVVRRITLHVPVKGKGLCLED